MMSAVRRVSAVLILIVIVVKKGANAFREKEDVQPRVQDFMDTHSPATVNVAVVSFDEYWHEADNSLTQRLPWPRTTWTFKEGGFLSYILHNSAADVSTVAIVSRLRFDWQTISQTLRKTLRRGFVRWIVARDNATFSNSEEAVSVLRACLPTGTQPQSTDRQVPASFTDIISSFYDKQQRRELGVFERQTRKTSLTGKVMKIACLRSKQFENYDICSVYSYLFGILEAKNVSLEYHFHANWSTMFDELYCENTDMVVLINALTSRILAASTYSEIMLLSETFYALDSKIEAPSLFDTTLQYSFTVAVTAASLTLCVGLLVLIGGYPIQERLQTETLLLVALLLTRSTPFPKATRWPRVQNFVYLFWALTMLPLSQYFQGELTSMVTVGRPASSLDTLQELEAALDAGVAAPCVQKESASLDSIMHRDHPTKLGQEAARVAFETSGPVGNCQLTLLLRLCHKERQRVLRPPNGVFVDESTV
ncbi:hypothetical protein MTO96_032850 [Rhipicephalus appendiculatus]